MSEDARRRAPSKAIFISAMECDSSDKRKAESDPDDATITPKKQFLAAAAAADEEVVLVRDVIALIFLGVQRAEWNTCYRVCKRWQFVAEAFLTHRKWIGNPLHGYPEQYWVSIPPTVIRGMNLRSGDLVDKLYSYCRRDALFALFNRQELLRPPLLHPLLKPEVMHMWRDVIGDDPMTAIDLIGRATIENPMKMRLLEYAAGCMTLSSSTSMCSELHNLINQNRLKVSPGIAGLLMRAFVPIMARTNPIDNVVSLLHLVRSKVTQVPHIATAVDAIACHFKSPLSCLSVGGTHVTHPVLFHFFVNAFGTEERASAQVFDDWGVVVDCYLIRAANAVNPYIPIDENDPPKLYQPFLSLLSHRSNNLTKLSFLNGAFMRRLYGLCVK